MTSNDLGDDDEPGPAALLNIELRALKARGVLPPGDASYFIRTIGIVGSVVTSTAGAADFRGTPYLAMAALVLGLVAIAAIAVRGSERRRLPARRGRRRTARASRRRHERPGRPWRPGLRTA